jgi:hypothetical protein
MKHGHSVFMDTTVAADLIQDAIAAAHGMGVDLRVEALEVPIADIRCDARLQWRIGDETLPLLAEVKRGLRPAMLGTVINQMARLGENALLITDYATPQLADQLREHGVNFIDGAGNAYLNRPPILVWIKGMRPTEKPTAPNAGRAFQATGLQVVFALLCKPEWVNRPYREIAKLAGVAHGTVGNVMEDLIDAGYVFELGRANRRLRNMARLADTWTEAYARTLRPKLLLGQYRAPNRDWWHTLEPTRYDAQLGGEPAAAKLDGYLTPGTVTLYADEIPNRLLVDHQLRKDPTGTVELRKRFWHFETTTTMTDLVPPLLIYADLLATGDGRCFEAANRIRERELHGLFDQN